MSAARYDAVIIGAGHNGPTCACYLARGGLKVKVLERRPRVGGVIGVTMAGLFDQWLDLRRIDQKKTE